jgi:hypothetical protein
MKESTNWYWTPDLRIVCNVAQSNGISEVCECSDVAYLEAEKEKLEIKRQEWVERANIATNTIRAVYFEEMLKEVDSQLKYVEQRLSELRKPAELLGGMDEEAEIPPSKMPSSEKLHSHLAPRKVDMRSDTRNPCLMRVYIVLSRN